MEINGKIQNKNWRKLKGSLALLQTRPKTSATSSSAHTLSKSSSSPDVLQQRQRPPSPSSRRVSLTSSDPGASSHTQNGSGKSSHPRRSSEPHASDCDSADNPQHQKSSRDVLEKMRREVDLLKKSSKRNVFEKEQGEFGSATSGPKRNKENSGPSNHSPATQLKEENQNMGPPVSLKEQLRKKALEWEPASCLPPLEDLLFKNPYGNTALNRNSQRKSFRVAKVNSLRSNQQSRSFKM